MKLTKIIWVALIGVLAISCSKSDDLQLVQQDNNNTTQGSMKDQGGEELCTLVVKTHPVGGPEEWDCLKPSANCFCDWVIITPDTKNSNGNFEIYQAFLSAVKSEQLDVFFTAYDWQSILPMLAQPYAANWLSLLQSNSVILKKVYNPYKDKYLFIAFDKNYTGEILPENSLFTFQVKLEK